MKMKFRVYDKFRKKFAKQLLTFKFDRDGDINLVVYLDKEIKNGEILDEDKIYTNEFEIMLSTGFYDKTHREIFVGDIVKDESGIESEVFINEGIIGAKRGILWFAFSKYMAGTVTVIGNKYEKKIEKQNNCVHIR
jgi:hypothetical protein